MISKLIDIAKNGIPDRVLYAVKLRVTTLFHRLRPRHDPGFSLDRAGCGPAIYVYCPDIAVASGGVKYLYRHVEVLVSNGLDACIVHDVPGFRPSWFQHTVPIVYRYEITPRAGDMVACPEVAAHRVLDEFPGVAKVIVNQNGFFTFDDHSLDPNDLQSPYRHGDLIAVCCTSEESHRMITRHFPAANAFRVRLGIDTDLFSYTPAKESKIAYMPRKNPRDARLVINMLKFRGALEGIKVESLDDMAHDQVAEQLKDARFFLSFSYREGLGLPPLEAMARGCVVVGFDGVGGSEYMKEPHAFPVPNSDVTAFADKVEELITHQRSNPSRLDDIGRAASEFVANHYSRKREADDILAFWASAGLFSDQ
jgi:hypothetical protein